MKVLVLHTFDCLGWCFTGFDRKRLVRASIDGTRAAAARIGVRLP